MVDILTGEEEGLYNLFFHNCDNYKKKKNLQNMHKAVNFTVSNLHLKNSFWSKVNYVYYGLCDKELLFWVSLNITWHISRIISGFMRL